ncbi:MAG TPA: TIR domain-containing protein, partial [Thermoanaerobaculia bacterium]|nr:TIR domain-containing protein [Thermoanaerobaculia bacterium]
MAVRLFVSYSHRDAKLKDQLVEHLSNLRNQAVITSWEDRQLVPGTDWSAEIQRQLAAADFVLLLISSSFLASGYCTTVEMKQALDSGRAIPILLRKVDWAGAGFAKLQVLPSGAKPVTSWKDRDAAFTDVVQGIRRAIASAPPPVSLWNVPHARNPNFVGREDLLDDLARALATDSAAAVVQAISGLGGVGKTQIAVEYAYRSRSDYQLVWWIRSELPTTLASDYGALAAPLGLPSAVDQPVIVAAVKAWLELHQGWLLIFDNVEKPEDVAPYLPSGRAGQVILTSRNPNWRGIAEPLQVDVMPPDDAVRLLLKRSGKKDEAAAAEVAKELGYLPLAIEQAAAYMEERSTPVADYLHLFRTRRKELWARDRRPLATVWQMSMERVRVENPAAEELLHLMAYLAPDDVPRNVLRGTRDPFAFEDSVAILRRYSLIKTEDDALAVHRLQQFVIRDSESPEEQARWCGDAASLLNVPLETEIFDSRTWPMLDRLIPHTLSVNEHAAALGAATEGVAAICRLMGSYLVHRAHFDLGDSLLSRAAVTLEMLGRSDSTAFASILTNMARSRSRRDDFEGALRLHESALGIDRRIAGEGALVATDLSNIASTLMR